MNWQKKFFFTEKTFVDLLTDATKGRHAPNFTEKTFLIATKLRNPRNFFARKFPAVQYVSYLGLIGPITSGLELGMKEPVHWLIRE